MTVPTSDTVLGHTSTWLHRSVKCICVGWLYFLYIELNLSFWDHHHLVCSFKVLKYCWFVATFYKFLYQYYKDVGVCFFFSLIMTVWLEHRGGFGSYRKRYSAFLNHILEELIKNWYYFLEFVEALCILCFSLWKVSK